MKIIIVGASGLLGSALVPKLGSIHNTVITMGRSSVSEYQCDVRNKELLSYVFEELEPDIIINLVALTDVDLCEAFPRKAYLINVKALENIVNWIESSDKKCHLVQISSDQVYDGNGPHSESQEMLTNYYAFSKYMAELIALRVPSTVLRTNFIGKSKCPGRGSFTDWIYGSSFKKERVFLFNDVFFSPLSMETLAEMISLVVMAKPQGVYNLGSRMGLSKSEFALLFADKLSLSFSNMEVISIDDVTFMKTYRPKDMRMDVTKFEQSLGIILPTLENEIDRLIGDYNEDS